MIKKEMNIKLIFRLLISLILFWTLLTANNTLISVNNLILGIVVSILVVVIFALTYEEDPSNTYNIKTIQFVKFAFLVFLNIYKASILYIKKILVNRGKASVINIDFGISSNLTAVLIANAITLTPGTITLKIFDDYRLKVLIQIDSEDDIKAFKREINQYLSVLGAGQK